MRAIVIATGYEPEMEPLNQQFPSVMTPFIDRPFIQHAIEFLAANDITQMNFVLSHLPQKIENLLGDGTRWGCSFQYHLVKDPATPYGQLRTISLPDKDEAFLLVHADRMICSRPSPPDAATDIPFMYIYRDDSKDEPVWSGWAWITQNQVSELPMSADYENLNSFLSQKSTLESSSIVDSPLFVNTFESVLESHNAILTKDKTDLMLTGREVQDGIWLSRNVMLNPTATLTQPVYIGANCRIGAGVRLGPNATIGDDCVLDGRCIVENSIVLPESYVGEALELSDVIIDRNSLINVRLGVSLPIGEDFILGSMAGKKVIPFAISLISRILALLMFLLFSPVLLLTVVLLKTTRKGTISYKTKVVLLPAGSSPMVWKTFFQHRFSSRKKWDGSPGLVMDSRADNNGMKDFCLRFLPGLVNVIKGEMDFVGVPPRTRSEIDDMPEDWKELYLTAKAGLITEAYIQVGSNPSDDDLFSSEAFFAVASNVRHNLKLLFRYFGRVLGLIKQK